LVTHCIYDNEDGFVIVNTHTTVSLLFLNMSGTTCMCRYQKGKTRKVKTNLNLLD